MRRIWATAAIAALLLSGCADDTSDVGFEGLPEGSESASPSPEPSPTASAEAATDEIDVTTTPDEITPEWVTAVVNTLLAEYGEMEAEILGEAPRGEAQLTEGEISTLRALFGGQYFERRSVSLRLLAADVDGERDGLLPPDMYGGLRFMTHLVQVTEPECVVAVGRVSRERTVPGGGPAENLTAVSLSRRSDESASEPNPTEWRILDLLPNTIDTEPQPDARMLDATLADYGDALEHRCTQGS